MAIFKEHRPGTLCYVELVSPDPDASRKFYMNLFGWEVQEEGMGEHGIYTQFLKEGEIVGALYKLMKEQVEAGIPPSWGTYLTVMDADASAEKIKELGGRVIMGPMDVSDYGRMCVVADPVGAVFQVWQPRKNIGVGRMDEANTLCWAENMTNDLEKSKAFYQGLFNWTTSEMPLGENGVYHLLGNTPETWCCGMMQITPEMGATPPNWLAYFQVEDLAATIGTASGLGAETVVTTTTIAGGGQFAVIRDPQGAFLGLYQKATDNCE